MEKLNKMISIVMPCYNEEKAIGICIEKAKKVIKDNNYNGEVIVCDNCSTDNSAKIAEKMGARVVYQHLKGYGNAYLKGFSEAKGDILIMIDADDTYEFNLIPLFIEKIINEQFDFVSGSRNLNNVKKNVMPITHKLFGNPLFTYMINRFFNAKYTDVYCGLRAFTKEAYKKIQPVSRGMEFNLEIAINAVLKDLKIAEIPIELKERIGESKLRTISDGWRSLRFIMLYSPDYLFLFPGFCLLFLGLFIEFSLIFGIIAYQGRPLGIVTGFFSFIISIIGFQIINLWLYIKTFSSIKKFGKQNFLLTKFYDIFNLEKGIIIGSISVMISVMILFIKVVQWIMSDFMPLNNAEIIPLASTFLIIGINIIFSSFFISALALIKEKQSNI